MHRSLVLRSLAICVVVGTTLTAINQGNLIVGGNYSLALAWKIPMTYAVPYVVSTTAGLLSVRATTGK